MAKQKNKPSQSVSNAILFELYGIVIFTLSLMAMAQMGAVGRALGYLSRFFVGNWDFLIPLGGLILAVRIMAKRRWPSRWSPRWLGILMIVLAFLIWNHMDTFDALEEQGAKGSILSITWE